ncbi:MAG TPA: HNH endonuclease [Nitrososphaerales archaeon]|nr:HNH endonuclease [Nitrososphaerales archaeon]
MSLHQGSGFSPEVGDICLFLQDGCPERHRALYGFGRFEKINPDSHDRYAWISYKDYILRWPFVTSNKAKGFLSGAHFDDGILKTRLLFKHGPHGITYFPLTKSDNEKIRGLLVTFNKSETHIRHEVPKSEVEAVKDQKEQQELDEIEQEKPLVGDEKERLRRELEDAKPSEGYVQIRGKAYKRDNKALADLKKFRGYACQLPSCNKSIIMKSGYRYVEAAHIKSKHAKGSELYWNILVLCPNHHKEFDLGDREIIQHTKELVEFNLNGAQYKIPLVLA